LKNNSDECAKAGCDKTILRKAGNSDSQTITGERLQAAEGITKPKKEKRKPAEQCDPAEFGHGLKNATNFSGGQGWKFKKIPTHHVRSALFLKSTGLPALGGAKRSSVRLAI